MDDNDELRLALARLLKRSYDVVAVDGGAAALSRLREDAAFDAVLCDLSMADVDGPALHEAVMALSPALAARFLFLSGTVPTTEAARYVERSGVRFVAKPIARDDLLAEIETVLATPRPPRGA